MARLVDHLLPTRISDTPGGTVFLFLLFQSKLRVKFVPQRNLLLHKAQQEPESSKAKQGVKNTPYRLCKKAKFCQQPDTNVVLAARSLTPWKTWTTCSLDAGSLMLSRKALVA